MYSKHNYLKTCEPPWLYCGSGESERLDWTPAHFYGQGDDSICVRRLRGHKMRMQQSLMDEFAAALQFPDCFGENWLALGDCLQSMDEWLPARAYVFVFEAADQILIEESSQSLDALVLTLHEAAAWWSVAVSDNGRFNRPARPFHALFHTRNDSADCSLRFVESCSRIAVPLRTD